MNRRDFLSGLAALAAVSSPLRALASEPEPPWALGFEGVSEDLAPLAMTVKGHFPATCQGTLYRNGPALYARAGERYQHWFDPDGMVQAFTIGEGGVVHKGRFVRTRRFRQEQRAGRFLFGGAGSNFANEIAAGSNDDFNVANINVQPLNGELLAMWEAGSSYRLDPDSLETLGTLELSAELKGVPFSAHPHLDEQGEMWNIGSVPFTRQPMLVLYHVGRNGQLRKSRAMPLDFAGYMHDFVLTPRYLVVLNSSAVLGEGGNFVDRMTWEPARPSQLLVFDREDFSLRATIEVPPTFVFHFGNGWEQGEHINFTACAYRNMDIVSVGMRRLAQQEPGPYHPASELERYTLSLGGDVQIERLGVDMEFPGYDQHRPFEAQTLSGAGGQAGEASRLASAVVRVDPRSGASERFDYGEGIVVEEPLPIPGPEDGYLLHSYLDYRRQRSGLALLKAARVADGPIATAEMERVLPLGFHGCFLPA